MMLRDISQSFKAAQAIQGRINSMKRQEEKSANRMYNLEKV